MLVLGASFRREDVDGTDPVELPCGSDGRRRLQLSVMESESRFFIENAWASEDMGEAADGDGELADGDAARTEPPPPPPPPIPPISGG